MLSLLLQDVCDFLGTSTDAVEIQILAAKQMSFRHQRTEGLHKRSRKGCLTCRSKHYKCDEETPICRRCRNAKVDCRWPAVSKSRQTHHDSLSFESSIDEVNISNTSLDSDAHGISATVPLDGSTLLNTTSTELITFYITKFQDFSYDL